MRPLETIERPPAAAEPCFTCPLPDCNEASPRCGLKVAIRAYYRALDSDGAITPAIRSGVKAYAAYRKIERAAGASSGRAAAAAMSRPSGETTGRERFCDKAALKAITGLHRPARTLARALADAWPRAARRSDLIVALWGDAPPRLAAASVATHFAEARKALARSGWTVACEGERNRPSSVAYRLVRRETAA